jgi:hypothetical protein
MFFRNAFPRVTLEMRPEIVEGLNVLSDFNYNWKCVDKV